MKITLVCIYCFLFMFFATSFACAAPDAKLNGLWNEYVQAKKLEKKIEVLLRIGDRYIVLDKPLSRDSIYDIAVDLAQLNDSLLFVIEGSYFSNENIYSNKTDMSSSKAGTFAENMLVFAKTSTKNERMYEAYLSLSKADLTRRKFSNAIDDINKAYYHVSQMNNEKLRAECMLQMGYCQELNNKKIEAFRSYMDALFIANKINSNEIRFNAFERLATFYFSLKKYEKAKSYRKQQFDLVITTKPIDSLRIMNLYYDFANVLYRTNEASEAKKLSFRIIYFSQQHDALLLKKIAFMQLRTYLVENALFNELRDLYQKQYPEEYLDLAAKDTSLYYRLNSYILEANGKLDSAQFFYNKAEDLMANRAASIPLSNFYKRYGEFLLRIGKTDFATRKFDSAYKYALAANYFPYLIETTHYLDSLNYLQKDVDKAYQFAILNKHYTEQQAEVNKGEEMLQLEVENEARQQELRVQMEEKETERRHNLQYTGMVIAIISFFILLTLLGTFKVHPGMIRALGFFSFIFFFEFITMIADHRIHDYTHGEPWKFMAFKIVLIAGLLPLHHWLEEKVIHYLVHHRMLDSTKLKMKIPAIRKKEKPVPEQKPSDN